MKDIDLSCDFVNFMVNEMSEPVALPKHLPLDDSFDNFEEENGDEWGQFGSGVVDSDSEQCAKPKLESDGYGNADEHGSKFITFPCGASRSNPDDTAACPAFEETKLSRGANVAGVSQDVVDSSLCDPNHTIPDIPISDAVLLSQPSAFAGARHENDTEVVCSPADKLNGPNNSETGDNDIFCDGQLVSNSVASISSNSDLTAAEAFPDEYSNANLGSSFDKELTTDIAGEIICTTDVEIRLNSATCDVEIEQKNSNRAAENEMQPEEANEGPETKFDKIYSESTQLTEKKFSDKDSVNSAKEEDISAKISEDDADDWAEFSAVRDTEPVHDQTPIQTDTDQWGEFSGDDVDTGWSAFGNQTTTDLSADLGDNGGDWASFSEPTQADNIDQTTLDEDEFDDQDTALKDKFDDQDDADEDKFDDFTGFVGPGFPESTDSTKNVTERHDIDFEEQLPPTPCSPIAETRIADLQVLLDELFVSDNEMSSPSTIDEINALLKSFVLPEQDNPSHSLSLVWKEIENVEVSPGIRFKWDGALVDLKLLNSLHVDRSNILSAANRVPVFASGLSSAVLEPVRGTTFLQSGSESPVRSTAASSSTQGSTPDNVEFDWKSSGLVDPLAATSGKLDLDFLVQKELAIDSNTDTPLSKGFAVLENLQSNCGSDKGCLDATSTSISTCISSTDTTNPPQSSHLSSDLLNSLLKSAKPTASQLSNEAPTTQLSDDANRLVAKLPELSFMKSSVLMFPILSAASPRSCRPKADT